MKKRRPKREYTPEQKEAMRERMAHARAQKKNLSGSAKEAPATDSIPETELAPQQAGDLPAQSISGAAGPPNNEGVIPLAPESASPESPPPNHSGLETQVPDYTEDDSKTSQEWGNTRKSGATEVRPGFKELTTTQEAPWPAWVATNDPTKINMVVSQLPQNPRLAICTHPDYSGEQTVIVGNHENFIPGMEIPVTKDPAGSGYWIYSGALPRMRGRW